MAKRKDLEFVPKKLRKQIRLTDKEIEAFENFKYVIWWDNAGKYINGSYSKLVIADDDFGEPDEEGNEEEILICRATFGQQDENGSRTDKWMVYFNRKTLKFER